MWEGLKKKMGQKKPKKNFFCQFPALDKSFFAECQKKKHSAKTFFAECQKKHSAKIDGVGRLGRQGPFFCRVPLFAECCTRQRGLLPSAGHSEALGKTTLCRVPPGPALGKEWLRRVPDFWHSVKLAALGKSAFSRSGSSFSAPIPPPPLPPSPQPLATR